MQKLKEEPVMVATIAGLLVSFAGRHGLELPPAMVESAVGLIVLAFMWYARNKVTPDAKRARLSQAPPA